jgi:hypothetical protein
MHSAANMLGAGINASIGGSCGLVGFFGVGLFDG